MPTHFRTGRIVVALALLAGLLGVPAAARAGLPSAMDRCGSGAAPDDSQTTTARTTGGLSYPDAERPTNAVRPGDAVRVVVIGSIQPAPPFGGSFGPAGNGIPAGPGWPFPGFSEYSLVAHWNHDPTGWVDGPVPAVSLAACTPAPWIASRLGFYVNDILLGDNGGAFTVRTDLYYGS